MPETCERCNKEVSQVNKYHDHGVDKLLCSSCISEIDEYYSITCVKCGKPAHLRGNLIEYGSQKICPICMDEIRLKKS